MSLQRWKELAKSKTELGNKINFVHDTILRNDLGEKTSQESFEKVFKPITTKLDDVVLSNLKLPVKRRPARKKGEVPDYGIAVDDEVPDYGLDDLFDQRVEPQNEKLLIPKLPTYEESLQDLLEGNKQVYVNPQYLPEEPQDIPPDYDEDEGIDYAIGEEDNANYILDELNLSNYDDVEKRLTETEMDALKTRNYLKKKLREIKKAKDVRSRSNGRKSQISQANKKGKISEAEKTINFKRLDNARGVLNQYIRYYEQKIKTIQRSGLRRKQKGGNVVFSMTQKNFSRNWS